MIDKKGKLEKIQERIILQKNEQIRKISQEVEKMRLELKKFKTGVNKEFDQPNKSKKGRLTSKRRKREEIVDIPVLPENTGNDLQAKKAHDIFFYDIPKYWSEEDVRTNLMKIGMIFRLQIKGQHKYKTIKAKISLNENFEKTFKDERDQWQTVRDLTNEEMDSMKKGNIYDFTKKLQQISKIAFIKIIKITKNWKVIGYFKNLKEMEKAVEDSYTQGDINRVWLVRNKKTIYNDDGDDKSRTKKQKEKIIEDKKIATEPEMRITLQPASEPKIPMTSLERIYRELGNFASRKESLLHSSKKGKPLRISKTPDEEEVVEMIKNWRVGTSDHNDISGQKGEPSSLKKDNVAPEEVVDIIKDYRTTNKIKYVQYQESTHNESLINKLKEVKEIFNQMSNEMEWEKINIEAVDELRKEHGINNWDENENRYQDEKKIGEKRPILELPRTKKDEDAEEAEEKEAVESNASPSKKKSGKKKKKKGNKKH
ncbi:hypothetical protein RhiirC2_797996 [Rhizophagus irregularis]|uniref:Uncharacterized protein n=1 Tax=Rhizophagus irregularis TaxID=588596 RepID=A0A2N1M780_9GLOM|nr:hypothetical protein RhiirC2_797996 [Rhizophagus irregularis]